MSDHEFLGLWLQLKSPLEIEDVNEFMALNADYFKSARVSKDDSLINQYSELLPLLSDLNIADQARFWRYLRDLIIKRRDFDFDTRNTFAKKPTHIKICSYPELRKKDSLDRAKRKAIIENIKVSTIVIFIIILLSLFMFMFIRACSSSGSSGSYNTCVERGIQYYKEIGSYPYLKTENISAEDKVKGNCRRQPKTAF